MTREWEGMPDGNRFDEFYSICETCGRKGSDPIKPEWDGDEQCEVCLPLRVRVAWQEIEWILYTAMVKLGRLPDPWARTPEDWAFDERCRLRARKRAEAAHEDTHEDFAPLVSSGKRGS